MERFESRDPSMLPLETVDRVITESESSLNSLRMSFHRMGEDMPLLKSKIESAKEQGVDSASLEESLKWFIVLREQNEAMQKVLIDLIEKMTAGRKEKVDRILSPTNEPNLDDTNL